MSEILIQAKNIKKYFPTSDRGKVVKAVDDISFDIYKGETLGVVGESGCGKSTTGRMVLKLLDCTEGTVLYKGKDIGKMKGKEMRSLRKEMQIIFQDPYASLDPRKTVFQILAEPFWIHHPEMSKEEIYREVEKLIECVGLRPEHILRYPHEFSGGQRQRIGIARALAVEPELIIADEPVSALDVSIQAQVLNLLHQLQKEFNLTYIFVAHDLSVVEHISDRVGVMYLGNFVEVGDKRKLYSNPLHPYTQALLSAVPVPDPTAKKDRIILEGSIPSALNPPSGCKFHTRCPRCMDICKQKAPERYQVSDDHYVYCHLYDDKIKENKG